MKKIILGLIQTTLSPFIIILGGYLIELFPVIDNVKNFASVMGGCSIVFNFILGCRLIVMGYDELKILFLEHKTPIPLGEEM